MNRSPKGSLMIQNLRIYRGHCQTKRPKFLAFALESAYIITEIGGVKGLRLVTLFIIATAISACASLFLLVGIRRNRRQSTSQSELASVAIIVAGRNERATISRCLRSVVALDYPPSRIERFYVDDDSTDGTAQIAEEIAEASGGILRVLHAPPNLRGLGPKKNALAAAIEGSKANILLFTDADAEVPAGWAKAMAAHFRPEVGAVAGLFAPISRDGISGRLYRQERLMHGAISAGCVGWGYPSSVCGANFAYRRRCYEELQGFSGAETQAGDDDMMAQAIRRRGWRVRFATGADSAVFDLRLPTWREFLRSKKRHQSTARNYPAGWLMFFWMIILAQLGYVGGWIFGLFHPAFLLVAAAGFVFRALCDYLLLSQLAHSYSVRNPGRGFLLAEVLLPFYLLLQPVLALGRGIEWKERRLPMKSAPEASVGRG
jgi:cellulose synthase/poly-beta-1,6-N-acetylglucosamine synthase-like glycosyltransferase